MGLLDDAIRQHLELKRQHGAPEEELQRQEEEALGPARREVAPAQSAGGDGEVELEGAADEAPDGGPEADAAPADAAPAAETPEAEPAPAAEAPPTDLGVEAHEQETMLQEPEPPVESDSAADREPPAPYDAGGDLPAFEQDEAPPAAGALEPPAVEEDEPESRADEAAAQEPGRQAFGRTRPEEDEESAGQAFERSHPEEDEESAGQAFDRPAAEDDDDLFADEDDEPEPGQPDPADDVLEDTPDFLQETPEHDRLWFEQKPPRDFDFD